MASTSFGLVLFAAILLPAMSMIDNASGQGAEEETTEQNNTKLARQVIEAFNTRVDLEVFICI